MILLRWKQHGSRGRVCNEQCYNAKHKKCHCICGGINHGVGLQVARENTRHSALLWSDKPNFEVVLHQQKFQFPIGD
jgi:hypothetical protein